MDERKRTPPEADEPPARVIRVGFEKPARVAVVGNGRARQISAATKLLIGMAAGLGPQPRPRGVSPQDIEDQKIRRLRRDAQASHHQGARERARRQRQLQRGQIR